MPVQFQSYSPPSTQRPIVMPQQPSMLQSVGEILAAIGNIPAQMDAAKLRQLQMQQQQQQVQLQNQIATLPTTVQQPGQQVADLSPGWTLNEDVQPPSNIMAPQQAPTAGDIFGGTANIPGATVPNPAFEQARTKLDILRGKSPLEDQVLKLQLQNLGKQTVAETQAGSREKVAGVKADVTREGIASKERISTAQLKSLDENRKAIVDLRQQALDLAKEKEANIGARFNRHQADLEKLHSKQEDNYDSMIQARNEKTTDSNDVQLNKLKSQWSSQRKSLIQIMQKAAEKKDKDTYKRAATEYNRLAKLSNDNEEDPNFMVETIDTDAEFSLIDKAIGFLSRTTSGAAAAPTPPPTKTPTTTPAPKTTPPKGPTKSLDSILFGQ